MTRGGFEGQNCIITHNIAFVQGKGGISDKVKMT